VVETTCGFAGGAVTSSTPVRGAKEEYVKRTTTRGLGAFAVVALAVSGLAACGDDNSGSDTAFKPIYFVDGNLGNALGEKVPNINLDGQKGTLPGAKSPEDFQAKLKEIDPNLKDFSYGPETYDAVIVAALGAIAADSDAGSDIAGELKTITSEGEACTTFADCVALLKDGKDIDYNGVSGPIAFDGAGDPTEATIGVYSYGADNQLTDNTTFTAGKVDPSDGSPIATKKNAGANGTLTIGTLLPLTGSLAFLGPPEVAGAKAAIADINAADGALGKDVVLVETDSGDTTTQTASTSVDTLLSRNADVIIGAASSSVSLSVIDKITGAGVVQISPANTSPAFTDYADKGLYFRTAPSDVLQGRVLGNTVLGDDHQKIAFLQLQDSYGDGLGDSTESSIKAGGGEVVARVIYDPKATSFSAEVSQIKQANPDAIILIGFDETAKVLEELAKQGLVATKSTAGSTP